MLSPLTVVLPIFALILVGWLARRFGVLGPAATGELNRFVVNLALPTLLFDVIAHTHVHDVWLPDFAAVYGLSCFIVFAAALVVGVRSSRPLADAAIDGLNAGYPNTGYMGFPLALVALGPATLAPTTIATVLTVCVVFAIAIVLIEVGLQSEARRGRLPLIIALSLLRNPLLLGPAAGAIVSATGLTVPAAIEPFFKLLGGAASPCALVALGLFLAEKTADTRVGVAVGLLVAGKLFVQPAVAWLLATLFGLSPLLRDTVVLLAALPTGTGPFMLAEFYRREAQVTARVILLSTMLSIATIAGYLYAIG